jgi:hypothetical protein
MDNLNNFKNISNDVDLDIDNDVDLDVSNNDNNFLKTIAYNIVNESYNKNPDTRKNENTLFLENKWLDEYQHIDSEKLTKSLKKIYIYYPTQDISYTFNGELMTHIMENFRIPSIMKKYPSSIMGYLFGSKTEMFDKKWGYIFYIFTNDFIFYGDGIKNERGTYFNMIPLK